MEPVRIAVIGAGLIGARHVRLAHAEPDCRLVAVADPAPEAAAVAQEAGVPLYADHEAMLAEVQPQGAIVAVPTPLHVPVGKACAQRGVHLLVEKPVADSVTAGLALVEAAERAGVRMLVGHHRRHDPAVAEARTLLQQGAIGRLLAVNALWAMRKPDAYFDAPWRSGAGGGPVLINLIHDIDLLRHLCGEIAAVQAATGTAGRGLPAEDTAAVLLRFASGALGTVTLSDAAPSPWGWELATGENPHLPPTGQNCYHFLGSAGALEFPNLVLWRQDGQEPGDWTLPIAGTPRPVGERDALAAQLRHFCQVVRGTAEPLCGGREGLATLAATVAVLEAAQRGQPTRPACTPVR